MRYSLPLIVRCQPARLSAASPRRGTAPAILIVLALLGAGAHGATQSQGSGPVPADAQEMAGIFNLFCLRAFPDDRAIDAAAARDKLTAMSPAQVRQYLHDDPGRGWYDRTSLATYVITIEHPPVRACAVRRMTGSGFSTAAPYLAAVNAYAATRGLGPLRQGSQQTAKTPDGADIVALPQFLAPPGAKSASEVFMVLLTDYQGKLPRDLTSDIPPGTPGVEVRYVHQIPPRQ